MKRKRAHLLLIFVLLISSSTGAAQQLPAPCRPAIPAPACGTTLSFYPPLGGEPSFSNGQDQGTGCSCAGAARFQCVEYVKRFYSDVLTENTNHWTGDANEYLATAAAKHLGAFRNGASTPPAPDDILVFEGSKYGHVAIVTDVMPTHVNVIEQNWSPSGTASVNLTTNNGIYTVGPRGNRYFVIGWLRTMSDNFNESLLNPGRWITTVVPPGVGTVAATNQELEMTKIGTGGSYQGLATTCSVSGDFDVQVDYRLLTWPAQNFHTVRLAAKDLPDGQFGHVGVYRNSYGNENYQFRSQSPIAEVSTSDRSGTMRLTRSLSTVSGYYSPNGGPFAFIGSAPSTNSNTGFVVDFATPLTTAAGNISIAFDNFKVNAGTVVCPQ